MKYCLVNGQASEQISVRNRGLAFGDGVFTTAYCVNGKLLNRQRHLNRLKHDSARIGLTNIDWALLQQSLTQISVEQAQAVVKIIITAGDSERGYARQASSPANIILQLADYPTHYQQWQQHGIELGFAKLQLAIQPQLAGIKHLNRLEQVLLKAELATTTLDDLIVASTANKLIETTMANLCVLIDGRWLTPRLNDCGVAGIARQILLDAGQLCEADLPNDCLPRIEAAAICNSLMGVVPVRQIEQQSLKLAAAVDLQRFYNEKTDN